MKKEKKKIKKSGGKHIGKKEKLFELERAVSEISRFTSQAKDSLNGYANSFSELVALLDVIGAECANIIVQIHDARIKRGGRVKYSGINRLIDQLNDVSLCSNDRCDPDQLSHVSSELIWVEDQASTFRGHLNRRLSVLDVILVDM